MKKFRLLFVIIALSINFVFAQNNWINYRVDDKLTVKFPAQPNKLNEYGVFVKTIDTAVFILSTVDLSKTDGLDSATVQSRAPTSEFANSLKDGMLSEMKGFTLGNVNIAKWNNYTCYNINGNNTSTKMSIYAFIVFIGTHAYDLMAIMPDNHGQAQKNLFFHSLQLTQKKQ
jgi:hypothetical protein